MRHTIEISPEEARRRHAEGAVELLDVREPYEREAGHIAGSRHIPLDRLAAAAEALPRDRPVVVYCRAGVRSAYAVALLRATGHDAWSMAGGLLAWDAAQLPLHPPGGGVAPH
jgi:rhodanese-related sulfurtransferase